MKDSIRKFGRIRWIINSEWPIYCVKYKLTEFDKNYDIYQWRTPEVAFSIQRIHLLQFLPFFRVVSIKILRITLPLDEEMKREDFEFAHDFLSPLTWFQRKSRSRYTEGITSFLFTTPVTNEQYHSFLILSIVHSPLRKWYGTLWVKRRKWIQITKCLCFYSGNYPQNAEYTRP